ncbi:hypothetical protein BDV33DRAFT_208862 [Aspergillus novoparasiticus]|uniref:Uncharacterized protein n=1 Tax=Aspergillus novoparasiticus TaxID=986946 RepID=A0A5N6EDF8_9EURO|nr:hypothetical protein BDV33DRAFT_208862 [Aspergillus novoparasiticus]
MYHRLLILDSINDYDLFATIWHFIHGPEENVGEYFSQQRRLPHYIQLYREVQEEDEPPSKIEKDEKDYFQNKDVRNTIARKLTLISEWKTQYTVNNQPRLRKDMFVACPKLWKWVQEFMQDWEYGPWLLMCLPREQDLKRMRSTGTSRSFSSSPNFRRLENQSNIVEEEVPFAIWCSGSMALTLDEAAFPSRDLGEIRVSTQ